MQKFASLIAVLAITCASLSSANTPRFFKMDGGTDARYIALAPDGNYSVTTREHMFVRVEHVAAARKRDAANRFSATPTMNSMSPIPLGC